MRILVHKAVDLFISMGFAHAVTWEQDELQRRVSKLNEIVDAKYETGDDEADETLCQLKEAIRSGEEIVLIGEGESFIDQQEFELEIESDTDERDVEVEVEGLAGGLDTRSFYDPIDNPDIPHPDLVKPVKKKRTTKGKTLKSLMYEAWLKSGKELTARQLFNKFKDQGANIGTIRNYLYGWKKGLNLPIAKDSNGKS